MMSKEWKFYSVEVSGYGSEPFTAPAPGKALYSAYMSDAFSHITFGQFMKIARARRCAAPSEDGYDYVRRSYGVSPTIGQRCRLRNEGRWNGKEGTVIYPGRSTASIRVVMDDLDEPVIVHPLNIELLPLAARHKGISVTQKYLYQVVAGAAVWGEPQLTIRAAKPLLNNLRKDWPSVEIERVLCVDNVRRRYWRWRAGRWCIDWNREAHPRDLARWN